LDKEHCPVAWKASTKNKITSQAMKKRYYILFFILLAILFRGQLFRFCVSYEPAGNRDFIALNDKVLVQKIDDWGLENPGATPKQLIAYARKQTARNASFVMRSTSGEPDDIAKSGRANCVGYARLFAAILDRVDTDDRFRQEILIGKISLFGQSLHQLTNDPFWSDHDYNKVIDVNSGEVLFLDTTLYDYLGIRWVE
jgi:hypothetical protein